MNKVNWRTVMLEEIRSFGERRPRLLLHVCCAPCTSGCLEELSEHFSVTLYYYNPNISPEEEFEKRACEVDRLAEEMSLPEKPAVIRGRWEPEKFDAIARGLEDLPEGGERCFRCYRLRLEAAARLAARQGFDYFTTTLSISPYKNADKLNAIGGELSARYGVPYLFSDFKKNEGYTRSIRNSRTYGLYRQDWCGCVYSRMEAERKRTAKEASV